MRIEREQLLPSRYLIGREVDGRRAVLFMCVSVVAVQQRSRFHAFFRRVFPRKQDLWDACFSRPLPFSPVSAPSINRTEDLESG